MPRWGCMDSVLLSTTDSQALCSTPGPTEQHSLPVPTFSHRLSHSPGHPHRLHRVLALLASGDVLHPLGEPPAARLPTGRLSRWPVAALPKGPCPPGVRRHPDLGRTRWRSCCHQQSCGERSIREGQTQCGGPSPGCLKLLSLPFSLPFFLPISLSIPIPLPYPLLFRQGALESEA